VGRLGVDSMVLGLKAAFDPARPTPAATFELEVDGEPYALRVGGGRLDVRRAEAERPAATATTDAETLRGIVEGRRTVADAVERGDLRTDGPAAAQQLTGLIRAGSRVG
jgi:hypothetical protein